jgi:Transposase DDE domain
MFTDFFASDDIEATARRTGLVKRASKITGKIFLALVTCGVWSDAAPTLAQLAAKVPQLGEQLAVSPEALHQRMHQPALVFLQAMIRQALTTGQSLDQVCDDGLLTSFPKVYWVDSTGFGLPESLKDLFPGSGGSATTAGAKLHTVWDYKRSKFAHCALTAWNIPDKKYVDTGVAFAQQGILVLWDWGYFTVQALAHMAEARAYFLSRLNPQTNLYETVAGHVKPCALVAVLPSVKGNRAEKDLVIGAKDQVKARLMVSRVPEISGNERRRKARKNAQKKGYTPSQAHLTLWAWHLFMTHVPQTIWKTAMVVKVYPWRWQIELIFKSWKSSRHLASIKTKKEDTTWCYLYGRMLFMVLHYALCPPLRTTLWVQNRRELSVRKLVRHFQAFADRWMQAVVRSEIELYHCLTHVCATAERLGVKASRKRRTTAQILRESVSQHRESAALAMVINA